MLDNVKFTLYEFFGYLLPGIILELGCVLAWRSALHAKDTIVLASFDSKMTLALLLLFAYVLGHVAQGVANLIFARPDEDGSIDEKSGLGVFTAYSRKRVAEKLGADSTKLQLCHVSDIADQAVQAVPFVGDRDLFIYREGFYRGLFVACSVLSLGLLALFISPCPIEIDKIQHHWARRDFLVFSSLSCIVAVISWRRAKRFAKYKFNHIHTAFFALQEFQFTKGQK